METALKQDSLQIHYTLNEEDFLNLQLYHAFKNEDFKKQRIKDKYRIIGLSLLCGLILFFDGYFSIYSYYFLGSAVLFFIVHPWWSKWFYKRLLKSKVINANKDCFPQTTTLILQDKQIDLINNKNSHTFDIHNLLNIEEIQEYFFLQISNFPPIIIPKRQIPNINLIQKQLKQYNKNFDISFITDLEYRWK
ncbi:hypothetical protein JGH11_10770 [Dysgonomonas sp. Marseille-P4677]|uniref:hypothetical protein n=1 Tax=Dysgonomonas sp. Marseille-P4677 TaxID=2364790 RepID=UPI0019141156|nr:hypothetical protein [Dysgonomonas sp. Marseille-P4677]MBK5721355.1 hypothetical protein [Dysgonomonas sp. Marseille-P4677]